jgi:hypothetical protein
LAVAPELVDVGIVLSDGGGERGGGRIVGCAVLRQLPPPVGLGGRVLFDRPGVSCAGTGELSLEAGAGVVGNGCRLGLAVLDVKPLPFPFTGSSLPLPVALSLGRLTDRLGLGPLEFAELPLADPLLPRAPAVSLPTARASSPRRSLPRPLPELPRDESAPARGTRPAPDSPLSGDTPSKPNISVARGPTIGLTAVQMNLICITSMLRKAATSGRV